MNNFNRRRFLKAGCQTILGAGLMTGPTAKIAQAQSGAARDYAALVCINLDGGNDGFNMLVPSGGAAYDEYADGRGHLATGSRDLLALKPATANTTPVGLNPFLAKLKPLFDNGNLAFQANVGTLIEPANADDVRNESAVSYTHLTLPTILLV